MEGTKLGAYRIDSELGSGGMGKVYLAEAAERCAVPAGTRVALKVVHPHLLSEPGFFKRFLREAEIGKAVTHPNVVRCYDCDQLVVDGTTHAFLVMEYVEGQTLRDLLDELETVPEELCRHVGREVSKGLAAIHDAGVVHRDLKPENVLITPDHEVKVMDLGVARLADEAIRLSMSGAFVGSVLYAAPEQFHGTKPDGRADLFALGVILYELVCGAHPHPGDDFASVLAKVVEEKPRRLGERNPQLSAFFEEVVHALLAKDREDRFDSGSKLLEVLTQGEKSTWWGCRAKALRAETKRPLRRIRIPRETAVYGREEELGKLKTLYEKAKSGDGQIALIEGEAGIGKTRLVDELVGRLQQDGEDLNFLFGSYPPGGAATASGAWSSAYREQFGAMGLEGTLEDYLTVAPILVPAFAALLRGEPPPEGKEPLTKDSLQTVFVHATRALAAERTTVVLIEDLHFAPEEGRGMFASLGLAVPEHPILLVGTARPGIPEDWRANLERLEQASRMQLSRLGPKDLAQLLEDSFRSERLAEELGMLIAKKSDGNPFFVFEIIRGLREGQFITRQADGTWVSTQVIQEIEIPSSVQDLIQARIADLDEEEQELLDVAACCGFEFDPGLVAEATELPRVPGLRRLAHLEKSHRLVRSTGRSFSFDHHQIQEILYEAIPEQLREEYHASIGQVLRSRHPDASGATAVDICEHLLRGGRGEEALPHLNRALENLNAGYLNDRAVELADRALAMEGLLRGEERARAVLRKAGRLRILGRLEEERDALNEARRISMEVGSSELQARVGVRLGGLLRLTSRLEEALSVLEEALELASSLEEREVEADARSELGSCQYSLSRYDEALESMYACLGFFEEIGDRKGVASVTGNLGLVFLERCDFDRAREYMERSLGLSQELGDLIPAARAVGNLGVVAQRLGRPDEAVEYARRSSDFAREAGYRLGESRGAGNIGAALIGLGRYSEALPHCAKHATLSRETGYLQGQATAALNLGLVHFQAGRWEDAQSFLEESIAFHRQLGNPPSAAITIGTLGMVFLKTGRLAKAEELLHEWLEITRDIGEKFSESVALINLSHLRFQQGRYLESRQFIEEGLALTREVGARGYEADALNTLGHVLLKLGALAEAREQLLGGLACARDSKIVLQEGLANLHLGVVAEAEGDLEEASSRLREAIEIFPTQEEQAAVAEALVALAAIEERLGQVDSATAHCDESISLASQVNCFEALLSATVHRASLPGGDPSEAAAALAELESKTGFGVRQEARFLMWKLTGAQNHLEEAHRLLCHLRDHAPEEYRETMIANVPLHREIMTAWGEHGET